MKKQVLAASVILTSVLGGTFTVQALEKPKENKTLAQVQPNYLLEYKINQGETYFTFNKKEIPNTNIIVQYVDGTTATITTNNVSKIKTELVFKNNQRPQFLSVTTNGKIYNLESKIYKEPIQKKVEETKKTSVDENNKKENKQEEKIKHLKLINPKTNNALINHTITLTNKDGKEEVLHSDQVGLFVGNLLLENTPEKWHIVVRDSTGKVVGDYKYISIEESNKTAPKTEIKKDTTFGESDKNINPTLEKENKQNNDKKKQLLPKVKTLPKTSAVK